MGPSGTVVVLVNSLNHLRQDYNSSTNVPVIELLGALSQKQLQSAIEHPIEYIGPFLSIIEAYFIYEVLRLRQAHASWIRTTMTKATILRASEDEILSSRWRLARLIIEDFDLIVGKMGAIQGQEAFASQKFQAAYERYRKMISRARLLEQHVRDDIQLNVGNLALQESRKSLQQADNIGRISILAFIFVPISLVTSFFGMNIKQLTGFGVPWRTFFLSSAGLCVALLLVTIISWIPLQNRYNSGRYNRRLDVDEEIEVLFLES